MGRDLQHRSPPTRSISSRDENPVTANPSFPALTNRDARNSFRFRSYENCRVGVQLSHSGSQLSQHSNSILSFRFPISFLFSSLHTLLHFFALRKIATLLFSIVSALCVRKHECRGGALRFFFLKEKVGLNAGLRLFATFSRIPVRMSATISCLTSQRSSLFATPATPGPTLFFSTLMGDEAKTIARGLQRRDPDLLDRLIEQYQYRLFRYLVYVTGNKERAEDFFQETWIRVLERGHQYDGRSKFEAWLFAIARHLVIDWQRTKKPQSLDTLTDPEQEHPLQLADEKDPSPLHQVLSQETEENVQTSLQKIPAIYREVLVLRFQEELQIEEMAGVLSVPLSTVKSRLYRGLEALRGALQGGAA
jgi:RNA polymerase sigma-70 factor (ECF subfamily)